jgi:hypothetical protein
MGIGLISGLLRPQLLTEQAHADIVASLANLHHFTAGFHVQYIGAGAFFESALRYGRTLLLIWACGILPKARYAALIVLYMRSMALGFSAAIMAAAFGGGSFGAGLALYGLQNLIIMPIYAYTAYFIIKYRPAATYPENLAPIIKVGVAGLLAVVAVSAIEVYIVPILFIMFWR